MNNKTFLQLIQLNKDFYDNVYEEFNSTRQSSWQGWYKVIDIIHDNFIDTKKKIKILDLGCGNGRFLEFLSKNLKVDFEYVGVDANEDLLSIAQKNAKNLPINNSSYKFLNHDIIQEVDNLTQSLGANNIATHYDVVVAFGLTHHIPSKKFRNHWFQQVAKFIANKGFFIFTIWKYNVDARFRKAQQSIQTDRYKFSSLDLEKNDYFLGFDNKNFYRYIHIYDKGELEHIDSILVSNNLELINRFLSDGKSNSLNEYFIYKLNDL